MADFSIPKDVEPVLAALDRFVRQEVLPLEEANRALLRNPRRLFREDGRFIPEFLDLRKKVRMLAAEAGFYAMFLPEEMGGAGLGPVAAFCAFELLGTYGPHPLFGEFIATFPRGPSLMMKGLKEEARKTHLPPMLSGERTCCFAFSEAEAGSDAWNMKTAAELRGGKWVVNGQKMWITNAPYAEYSLLFAVTNRALQKQRKGGITAFFVETSRPGFKVDAVVPVMGELGGDVGIVTLEDLEVPEENVVGEVDRGFGVGLQGIGIGRMKMGGNCVGLARWALERSVEYAKQRVTFGKPIAERQAIQWMLADSAVDIATAKHLALNAAWRLERGEPATKQVSMVKLYATEMLFRVMDRAIQVHGGMGLANETGLEEAFRSARVRRIPDGSSEIQRGNIARALLKGDLGV